MMYGRGKSSPVIVARKPANKAQPETVTAAESVERRARAKGNADQPATNRTQSRGSVSQALERIRHAIAVWTRGGSRMRESHKSGSVRARSPSVPTATKAPRVRILHEQVLSRGVRKTTPIIRTSAWAALRAIPALR
jgi:hypothetical protein